MSLLNNFSQSYPELTGNREQQLPHAAVFAITIQMLCCRAAEETVEHRQGARPKDERKEKTRPDQEQKTSLQITRNHIFNSFCHRQDIEV